MFGKGTQRVVAKAHGRNVSKAVYVTESVKRLAGDKIGYGKVKIYSTEVGEVKEEKRRPSNDRGHKSGGEAEELEATSS